MLKIKPICVLILLLCLKQSFLVSGDDWYKRKYEGWYFYEEKNQKKSNRPEKITPEKAPEIVKGIRKKLEELLSMAILDPTQENVRNYMQEQQKWVSQSSAFAKTWSDVILNHPILADRTPITQSGIRANEDYE
ncbi:MAG: conjugal transfer protein TraF, partial [Chlamydiia bacterium]|nr:conjugal transfer protein TraF [Chlamydiia bacterium]